MVPDPLPSLTTPRRRPSTGPSRSRWLPLALALILLLAALAIAWLGPSMALRRLDRALTPDASASR